MVCAISQFITWLNKYNVIYVIYIYCVIKGLKVKKIHISFIINGFVLSLLEKVN